MTLIPHRCKTRKGIGPDSFPVAPEAVLTRTRCIKGRPHENRGATLLFFRPSQPAPRQDSNQSKHFTESLKLVTTSSISDPAINHDSPVLSGSKS